MRIPGTLPLLLLGSMAIAGPGVDVPFTENKGQWPAQVLYRANIPGGALLVEKGALTYVLTKGGPLAQHGHGSEEVGHEEPLLMNAYRVTFEGSTGGIPEGNFRQAHYENFFLGSDPKKWAAGCGVYGEIWVRG